MLRKDSCKQAALCFNFFIRTLNEMRPFIGEIATELELSDSNLMVSNVI